MGMSTLMEWGMPVIVVVVAGAALVLPPGFIALLAWGLWKLSGNRGR